MKMFSDCSGPCKTCKTFHLPGGCIAGRGDNGYVYADAEWIAALEKKQANRKYAQWVAGRRRKLDEV